MDMNHRERAQTLLDQTDFSLAAAFEKTLPVADQQHAAVLTGILTTRAMVHATLARNGEAVASTADMRDAIYLLRQRESAMRAAVAGHLAKALVSKDIDRWRAARELSQALDQAGANVDREIDDEITEAGYQPRTAWNGPGEATPHEESWAAAPDITADIPAPVRRVLAQRIAEMLIGPGDAVPEAARRLTFALKGEGADLTAAIQARISDMTLGPDPSDPPF